MKFEKKEKNGVRSFTVYIYSEVPGEKTQDLVILIMII